MRFTARGAAALAATIAAAAAVGACGSSDSGGSSGGGKSLKGQSITYWASNQGATLDDDKRVLNGAIAKFTKQSGVKVNFKVIPWPDLFNNITTAVTSGKGPDVLNIGNTWSATLQSTGAFLPFQDNALNTVGGKSKFLSSSWAASGAPGKTPTSVPLYGLSYGLFYNPKLFKQAGISGPPKTWSEFVADAKKLTKPDQGQWGAAVEGASITENAHWAFILGRQNGGQLFQGNKPTFDTDGVVKGVKDYIDLVGGDKVANPSNAQYSDGTQALSQFSKGKTGMIMWQNNAENNLKANGMKPGDYAVADVPVADGSSTPVMTHVAGINVSVFQNSQHQDAALAFVKFLTSPQEQVSLNTQFHSLPVTADAAKNPTFTDNKELKTFNSILADHAEPMPLINEEGQMETIVGGALKSLFATAATKGSVSDADVKSALSAANQKMAAAGAGG